MTLRRGYALGLSAATALAMLGVLLGGELPALAWLALAAPVVAARRVGESAPRLQAVGTVLAVGSMLWGVTLVLGRGLDALLLGGATALLGILAARLVSRQTLAHDLQALLLSLLLVLAGSGLHTQLTYGVVFVGYALAAAWALVLRQLCAGAELEATRAGGAPLRVTLARRDIVTPTFVVATGAVALLVLGLTSGLFVLFPRIGIGSLAFLRGSQSLLPTAVRLDQAPLGLSTSGDVVARVAGLDEASFDRGLYLRAAVFEAAGTKGFAAGTPPPPEDEVPLAAAGPVVTYDVFLQPVVDRQLPTLGPFRRASLVGGGSDTAAVPLRLAAAGSAGTVMALSPLVAAVRYRIEGGVSTPAPLGVAAGAARQPSLSQRLHLNRLATPPSDLDGRVATLAQSLTAGAGSAREKAERLRRFLRGEFSYTLEETRNAGAADPVASFLFDDRRGHCEFFAASFALLLRAVRVPARVVGGFAGGAWDSEAGLVVFTGEHAHAWVEWYEPGVGWVLDDATPYSEAPRQRFVGLRAFVERLTRLWDDWVVDYGLDQQLALARRATESVSALGRFRFPTARELWPAAAALLLAGLLWAWRRRRTWVARDALATAILAACERLGQAVPPSMTLRQGVARLAGRLEPAQSEALGTALAIYESGRFSGTPAPRAEVLEVRRRLLRLSRQRERFQPQGSAS